MQLTRRSRAVVALAGFTAAYAVILARPLALAGTAVVGAWLLARQYAFVRQLDRVIADLEVTQVPDRTSVRTDETERVHLSASTGDVDAAPDPDGRSESADDPGNVPDVTLSITAGLPTAAIASQPLSVELGTERSEAAASTDVEWPVAGRHEFEPAEVTVSDGWFGETLPVADRPTVIVEPRGPRSIHVGEGGDRYAMRFGGHGSERRGSGLEPAEVREYAPGDDVRRIDWKATARLATPHVREFEVETDRRTVVVVDARSALANGPPDETALEYLKQVALAIVESARRLEDPVGLVTVGDGGIATRIPARSTTKTGVRIRRELLDLEPSGVEPAAHRTPQPGRTPTTVAATQTNSASGETARGGAIGTARTTAADAQAARATLDTDDAFGRTLQPFYADRAAYVERVESEPLFAAVEELLAREPGNPWTVILTDDSARAELRETVANARDSGSQVLVAIAPQVLYDAGGLADVERAYERYVDFEEFRRTLGRQPGVTALEVGPADRLATVLDAGRGGDRS